MLTNPRDTKNIRYNRVGRCATELLRIFYFQNGGRPPCLIFNFHIFAIFVRKKSNLRLFLRRRAKFGEDRTLRVRVVAYFHFSKWCRPPSLIWYDVIADHPRLVFDSPNIRLKLHVDRVYILRDISIFRLDALALSVIATATWLAGWLAGWVSVTLRYCIKTAKPIRKLFRPSESPITLVF